MKKILVFLLFVISFLFTGSSASAEQINNFDSQISINKDGTVDVKETIIYDFGPPAGGLQKHGIYREIPYIKTNQDGKKYQLKFSNFSVIDENGNDYPFVISYVDEQIIRLKIGDVNRLITGIHTYVISYQVAGALTYFSDHDELYWNVTGNKWPVPIASTTSQVVWPQEEVQKEDFKENIKGICYTGGTGSKESLCQVLQSQDDRPKIVIKSNGVLESREGLTIAVSFPKNIVAVLEPEEFSQFFDTLFGRLVSWLLGLLALCWYVFLPSFIIYRWFRYGRDPSIRSTHSGQIQGIVSAWFDPPKTVDGKRFLTPGEVGTLGDESEHWGMKRLI